LIDEEFLFLGVASKTGWLRELQAGTQLTLQSCPTEIFPYPFDFIPGLLASGG
jgi:hypothetical protein